MKIVLLMLVVVGVLVGCGEGSDNESYTGVPKDGQTCVEAYKLPVNVGKCVQAEGRH